MKKLLLFIIFILTAFSLYASPYGTHEEWDGNAQEYRYKRAPFLMAAMHGAVRIKMVFDYAPGQERAAYEELVREAINDWFAVAAKMIKEAGREREFADVYPIFARGITVSFVNSSPNSTVHIYGDMEGVQRFCEDEEAIGCHDSGTQRIAVMRIGEFNDKEELLAILKHEFGHALGLADQYSSELYTNIYISRRYSSPEQSECTIMSTLDDRENKICPDDVDGLINVIDLERLARGKPSPRGPWLGFMGRYVYHNGEPVGERKISPSVEKFTLKDVEEDGAVSWIVNKDNKDGTISVLKYYFRIDHSPVDIRKVIQRPIALDGGVLVPAAMTGGTGPNGEVTECYDLFRRTVCFGFMGGDMVWTQIFNRDYADAKGPRGLNRALFFKYRGVLVKMIWRYNSQGVPVVLDVMEQKKGEEDTGSFEAFIFKEKEEDPSSNVFLSIIDNEEKAVFFAPKKEENELLIRKNPTSAAMQFLEGTMEDKIKNAVENSKPVKQAAIKKEVMELLMLPSKAAIKPFWRQ